MEFEWQLSVQAVYEGLCANVSTLHSFYGLGTADLPWQMVVSRSLENSLCVERVKGRQCRVVEFSNS